MLLFKIFLFTAIYPLITSAFEIPAFSITEAWKRYPSRAEKPPPPLIIGGTPPGNFPTREVFENLDGGRRIDITHDYLILAPDPC